MSRERGFSLVEATMAALVLAAGLLTVLAGARVSRGMGERAAARAAAVDSAASALALERAGCVAAPAPALRTASIGVPVPRYPGERPVRVDALLACGGLR